MNVHKFIVSLYISKIQKTEFDDSSKYFTGVVQNRPLEREFEFEEEFSFTS